MNELTVGELIDFLKKYDRNTPVLSEKYENRWSGDLNDTDFSDYVATKSVTVSEYDYYVPWASNDPRRLDKRRTLCFDKEKCVIIRGR